MEPTSISATLTATLAALKALTELAKKTKNAELSRKLQELYDLVFVLQQSLLNSDEEIRRLKQENEDLKSTKEIESQLNFDGKVYWRTVNSQKLGPFCPNCWHDLKSRQLVPLQHQGGGGYYCTIHKQQFGGSSGFMAGGKPIFDPNKF
jgi:hypothetical protein